MESQLELVLMAIIGVIFFHKAVAPEEYHGALIGDLIGLKHGVKGKVYAADNSHLIVTNFSFDGGDPALSSASFFWVGKEAAPSSTGRVVAYEGQSRLRAFRGESVTITLSEDYGLSEIKYLSVWCRSTKTDYGHILIPSTLQPPKPRSMAGMKGEGGHVKSGESAIKSEKAVAISGFSYDGSKQDTYFMAGRGIIGESGSEGIILPNEKGSFEALGKYEDEDIELRLCGNLTFQKIDYISIYNLKNHKDLGHLEIPKNLKNIPADVDSEENVNCKSDVKVPMDRHGVKIPQIDNSSKPAAPNENENVSSTDSSNSTSSSEFLVVSKIWNFLVPLIMISAVFIFCRITITF